LTLNDYSDCRPLVVDDDEDFTLLLRRCFAKAGVPEPSVQVCSSGESAMEWLASARPLPSLIFLDHKMPRRTGLEVLSWIRSNPALGEIPVFMLSTGSEVELIESARSTGAEGYFVKPIDLDRLQWLLGNALAYWKGGRRDGYVPGSVSRPPSTRRAV
jgi:CheY-like chemotaxis protein